MYLINQQNETLLGICWKCKQLGTTPNLLNQKLWGSEFLAISVLYRLSSLFGKFERLWTRVGASQVTPVVRNLPVNAGDLRDVNSIPGSGRFPGAGHGNLLQCSYLENTMHRGPWQATVHRVAKSRTRLKLLSSSSSSSSELELRARGMICNLQVRTTILWGRSS